MPVTGYDIMWDGDSPGSGTFTKVSTVSAETFQYINTDVVAGTIYQFKVVAKNVVGDSPASLPLQMRAA